MEVNNNDNQIQPSSTPAHEPKKKSKKRTVILIITIIVTVAMAVGTITFIIIRNKQKAPVKTIEAFVSAMNDNNINEMLEYIEPSEAKIAKLLLMKADNVTDSKIFEKLTKWLPFLSSYTELDVFPKIKPEITNTDINDNDAVVTIKIRNDNTESYYDVYMTKIGEKWYIQYAWKSELDDEKT